MIRQLAPSDALLAHLRELLDVPVGDHTAPNPPGTLYHVLEAWRAGHDGALGAPGSALAVTCRIRTVAINANTGEARRAAVDHADRATAAVAAANTLAGTGWAITSPAMTADSGPIVEGPAVNVVRDYRLHIATA